MTTVSLFCGAGGEQAGKTRAFEELHVRAAYAIAINHWGPAVSVHGLNHPSVHVFQEDITQVTASSHGLKRIHLLQASPSCVHHSRARGGLPKQNQERSHVWEVVDRWLMDAEVDCFLLENVSEFEDWGPIHDDHSNGCTGDGPCLKGCHYCQPIKERKGEDFQKFVAALRHLGYVVEWKCLVAADFGDPTTRRRLFLQAVKDGRPLKWPAPTHRNPKAAKKQPGLFDLDLPPWRTAAECIDWSIPVPSIFDRKRPLKPATLRRIKAGIERYVLNGKPFIVNLTHGGRIEDMGEPMKTITTANRGEKAIVAPTLIQYHATQAGGRERGQGIGEPLQTVDTSNRYGLVAAFLAKHNTGVIGTGLDVPVGTVTAVDHHSLVAANLIQTSYGERKGQAPRILDLEAPLGTVVAGGQKHALVASFLTKYNGTALAQELGQPLDTVTTKDRHSLVTVEIDGATYVIVDIGMRMLSPRELARAMSFPESFRFERIDGKPLTLADQVKMIGNACPVATVSALVKSMLETRMDWFDEVAA